MIIKCKDPPWGRGRTRRRGCCCTACWLWGTRHSSSRWPLAAPPLDSVSWLQEEREKGEMEEAEEYIEYIVTACVTFHFYSFITGQNWLLENSIISYSSHTLQVFTCVWVQPHLHLPLLSPGRGWGTEETRGQLRPGRSHGEISRRKTPSSVGVARPAGSSIGAAEPEFLCNNNNNNMSSHVIPHRPETRELILCGRSGARTFLIG